MKVTEKVNADGTLTLRACASVKEVNQALYDASVEFAREAGLKPQVNRTVAEVAREELGIENLDAMLEQKAVDLLVPLAVDRQALIPAYAPQVMGSNRLARGREFKFELKVVLRPKMELSSYDPVSITVRRFTPDTSGVDARIEEVLKQGVAYVSDPEHDTVEEGMSCLLALRCTENGTVIPGLTSEAKPYTTGAKYMPDGFDREIIGMRVGQTKSFTFSGPSVDAQGREVEQVIDCTATVKEVQVRAHPELTDEWVRRSGSGCKTVAEYRKSVEEKVIAEQRASYDAYCRQVAAAALAERMVGAIDDEYYEAMRDTLLKNLRHELAHNNVKYEDYVAQNGGEQGFSIAVMMQTRDMLTQSYSLDAVFRHEHMVVGEDDLIAACREMVPGADPRQVLQSMRRQGRGYVVRESAERLKAGRWVLEHANVTEVD